jgi:hypothetical protein
MVYFTLTFVELETFMILKSMTFYNAPYKIEHLSEERFIPK